MDQRKVICLTWYPFVEARREESSKSESPELFSLSLWSISIPCLIDPYRPSSQPMEPCASEDRSMFSMA